MKNIQLISLLAVSISSALQGADLASDPVPPVPKTETLHYFAHGSYTYWYVKEEGMDLAESAILSSSGQTFLSNEGTIFQQPFSYQSGFQVGGGIEGDDWGVYTDYTWVRSKNSASKNAPANNTTVPGIGVWNVDDWFLQTTILGKSPTATELSSSCHLSLDLIDLVAEAPIHQRKYLKISGLMGLETVWIRQKMNISIQQGLASVGSAYLPKQPIHSLNSSHSWGIGPKMGLDTQYLFPLGFRIEGQVAASLLYTRFSSIKHYENAVSKLSLNTDGVISRTSNYSAVRPVLEMSLGLGWKTDFWDQYGFDLMAKYDFSLFWAQNVIRKMLDEYWTGSGATASDLYLEGLTIEACFRF